MDSMRTIQPLRHHQVAAESIPTGERLLDRSTRPFLAWVPSGKTIVLGNSQEPERELHLEAVQADGIPVFKRMSGGGAVLLSPGCVCLGLRFAKDKSLSIHDYFAKGSALIADVAREKLSLHLHLRGTSDLACAAKGPRSNASLADSSAPQDERMEKKVAGCALYMPRDFALYLVSILVDPDFADIDKYLAHPSKEPGYRAGRTHPDFLAGLASLSGLPVQPSEFADWLDRKIPTEQGLNLDWELCSNR